MNSSSKDNSNSSIIEKNYQSATEGSGAMNADDIDNAILPSKQEFIDDNNIEECNRSERDDSPPDEEFVVLTNRDGFITTSPIMAKASHAHSQMTHLASSSFQKYLAYPSLLR